MTAYKAGDASQAICQECKALVDTTLEYREVAVAGTTNETRHLLVASCNVCDEVVAVPNQPPASTPQTALEQYREITAQEPIADPVERLRFFCSLAMNGQDWLDVESFFDDVIKAVNK